MLFKKTPKERTPRSTKIRSSSSTQSQALITTATKMLVWALVICGPIGLSVAFLALTNNTPQEITPVTEQEPPGKPESMNVAEHVISTWLGASRVTEAEVQALGLPTDQLPERGLEVSAVRAVDAVWDAGAWTVTVAVDVLDIAAQGEVEGESTAMSRRRYFQLPLAVDEAGVVVVLGLPAEVAGPEITTRRNDYRVQIATTDPLATTAQEFAAALLVGSSDISRYTSPGAEISAVTPPPFAAATVVSVTALSAVSEPPAAGELADVVVQVRANDASGAESFLEYALAMVMRDGRWEVTAIRGAPRASSSTENPNR